MSSQLSWSIIKQFLGRNTFNFRFQDVVKEFPEKHRVYLARILADMVDKGMLCKITRDHYHIIPYNADPETYFPDGLQVAKYIMQNKGYYIAYSSVMYIHGLTDQPGARTAVVTERQRQPSKINIKTAIMRRDRWGWESHIPFQRKNRSPKAEQAFHC